MVNQEIVNYLAEGKKRGFNISLLRQKLLEARFNENDINEASDYLSNQLFQQPQQGRQNFPSQQPTVKLGIFIKLAKSIAHPVELFEKTKGESAWRAYEYLLVISLFPFVIGSFLSIFFRNNIASYMNTNFSSYSIVSPIIESMGEAIGIALLVEIAFAFSLFFLVPLLSLILSGIIHFFVKLYGGDGNYSDTFRADIYSLTPTILLLLVPWTIILLIFGLVENHNLSKARSFFVLLTIGLLISIIWLSVLLMSFYLAE